MSSPANYYSNDPLRSEVMWSGTKIRSYGIRILNRVIRGSPRIRELGISVTDSTSLQARLTDFIANSEMRSFRG